MPDLEPGETLQDVWAEAGFKGTGENAPLSWQELQAYANMTGTELGFVEWRIIREMSEAYTRELLNRNPLAMPPIERAQHE